MKATFRLYRRKRTYYCQHNETGQQESLRARDKTIVRGERDFPLAGIR
jgi:hypothetical protein